MDRQISILLYGRDRDLLLTRQLILQACGYRVRATPEISIVLEAIALHEIDLLVLCHTLSANDCGDIFALTCSPCPPVKTLVLRSGAAGCLTQLLDQVFDTREGPAKLVAVIDRMMQLELTHSHLH